METNIYIQFFNHLFIWKKIPEETSPLYDSRDDAIENIIKTGNIMVRSLLVFLSSGSPSSFLNTSLSGIGKKLSVTYGDIAAILFSFILKRFPMGLHYL